MFELFFYPPLMGFFGMGLVFGYFYKKRKEKFRRRKDILYILSLFDDQRMYQEYKQKWRM